MGLHARSRPSQSHDEDLAVQSYFRDDVSREYSV